MDYIIDALIPALKHTAGDKYIKDNMLKHTIWYGVSTQSYIQRTNLFDKTWLCSSTSDDYVMLLLLDVFNVKKIKVYDKVADCNSYVRALSVDSLKNDCLYIAKDKTSLFLNFWEKIRNAFAHGSINHYEGYFYLINQYKPKIDADVSFLLQMQGDVNSKLIELWDIFKIATEQEKDFKYRCLNRILRLKKVEGYYYSELHKCFVIVDDEFRYTTGNRVDDIKVLMTKYSLMGDNVVIIITENLGSISEKNLVSNSGSVRVIAQSKIIDYFNIQEVKQITDKSNSH